jgi:ribosomal-protein-alanine N-acetyltransferase
MQVRPIKPADAQEFATWRYPEPYSMYDAAPEDVDTYLDPANGYMTVTDELGEVIGMCCFGPDARVPGGTYDDDPIDIGTGMRPDLTGQGLGLIFFDAILDEASRRFPGRPLRTTVAAFNERAQRLVFRAGFTEDQRFRSPQGREFLVCVRRAS